MKRRIAILALAAAVVSGCSGGGGESNNVTAVAYNGPSPIFTSLGSLPDDYRTYAIAVSADGSVVAGSEDLNNGQQRTFRWTAAGGMVALGYLPGDTSSQPIGVSDDGSVIVGTSSNPSNQLTVNKAPFLWKNGTITAIPVPDGEYCSAAGVSGDGTVVIGNCSFPTPPHALAFRWTSAAGMVAMGADRLLAISGDGSTIVGYCNTPPAVPGGLCGAQVWSAANAPVRISGEGGAAQAVSRNGSMVAGFSPNDGGVFQWSAQSGTTSISTPSGTGPANTVSGISADGRVMVGYKNCDPLKAAPYDFTCLVPWIWTAQRGTRNLTTALMDDYQFSVQGWSLGSVGISADGYTLIGTGQDPSGKVQAWTLKLPH